MSEILDNAVTSIILGIEDFQDGTDRRILSAARNYYAGLLLLAKECLVQAAPGADAMDVIGARFKPIPDGDGGARHVVVGYATIDLSQLQERFRDFDLAWPDVNIQRLQKFRNDLEHYHLKAPASALRETIASSFPMIVDFFQILEEDPREHLADVWETIIAERATFEKVRASCLDSWRQLIWPAPVRNLDKLSCPTCQSSLLGQVDPNNKKIDKLKGKCFQCGHEIDREPLIEMVVAASYEIDDYRAARDGLSSVISFCPECSAEAYVETRDTSICFSCGNRISGQCARCGAHIGVGEYDWDYSDLCSYCAHTWEKVMRD